MNHYKFDFLFSTVSPPFFCACKQLPENTQKKHIRWRREPPSTFNITGSCRRPSLQLSIYSYPSRPKIDEKFVFFTLTNDGFMMQQLYKNVLTRYDDNVASDEP
uniref:Uncharacterized protein n=1 Tax=Romanomermis culicivorax TaxID=13658 RepID=A0A915IFZ0_ROMCU